jgi:hypothetical protein
MRMVDALSPSAASASLPSSGFRAQPVPGGSVQPARDTLNATLIRVRRFACEARVAFVRVAAAPVAGQDFDRPGGGEPAPISGSGTP